MLCADGLGTRLILPGLPLYLVRGIGHTTRARARLRTDIVLHAPSDSRCVLRWPGRPMGYARIGLSDNRHRRGATATLGHNDLANARGVPVAGHT